MKFSLRKLHALLKELQQVPAVEMNVNATPQQIAAPWRQYVPTSSDPESVRSTLSAKFDELAAINAASFTNACDSELKKSHILQTIRNIIKRENGITRQSISDIKFTEDLVHVDTKVSSIDDLIALKVALTRLLGAVSRFKSTNANTVVNVHHLKESAIEHGMNRFHQATPSYTISSAKTADAQLQISINEMIITPDVYTKFHAMYHAYKSTLRKVDETLDGMNTSIQVELPVEYVNLLTKLRLI